jgi:hypothetical protein
MNGTLLGRETNRAVPPKATQATHLRPPPVSGAQCSDRIARPSSQAQISSQPIFRAARSPSASPLRGGASCFPPRQLHSDSVQVEGSDRGRYNLFPSVKFVHFHGITPRRYRELFERGRRKDAEGKFVAYVNYASAPIVDVKTPFYVEPESVLVNRAARAFLERLSKDHTVLHEEPVAAE